MIERQFRLHAVGWRLIRNLVGHFVCACSEHRVHAVAGMGEVFTHASLPTCERGVMSQCVPD